MKRFVTSLILSFFIGVSNANAFDVQTGVEMLSAWNDPTIKTYTIVYVDPRKVKVSVADALKQWPNSECVLASDALNTPVTCPGMVMTNGFVFLDKVLTFATTDQFFGYVDPKDFRKHLKVDGVKQKVAANFVTPNTCTSFGSSIDCGLVPDFKPMRIDFDHPVTHFAMQFRENWDLQLPFSLSLNVKVNGVDYGDHFGSTGIGPNMVNVGAGPGEVINSIEFTPSYPPVVPTGMVFGALWYN